MSPHRAGLLAVFIILLCVTSLTSAEEVTVTGQVLGPDGQPVAEARVFVLYLSPQVQRLYAMKQAQSDPEGRFSFDFDTHRPERPVQVGAYKEGWALQWDLVEPGGEIALRLVADAVRCAGMVTDPEGNAIAGITVFVNLLSRGDVLGDRGNMLSLGEDSFLRDTTDEDGMFEIWGLPADVTVYLRVLGEGWTRARVGGIAAGDRQITIVAHPEATISGTITRDGHPVSGVEIFCTAHDPPSGYDRTVSARDGTYELKHLGSDVYDVMVDPPAGFTARAIQGITLEEGEHVADADLKLTPGGIVQGTVREATSGDPIPDVPVGAHGPARPLSTWEEQLVRTDETGTYALHLPDGKSTIYAGGAKGFPPALREPEDYRVDVVEGQTVSGIEFVLRPAPRLRGQVILPNSQPAANAEFGTVSRFSEMSMDPFFRARTDEQGRFDIEAPVASRHDSRWAGSTSSRRRSSVSS